MNKWLRIVILLGIVIVFIPMARLVYLYVRIFPKAQALEIESFNNVITRYTFNPRADKDMIAALDMSKKNIGTAGGKNFNLDDYYNSLKTEYSIDDSFDEVGDFYNKTVRIKDNNEMNEIASVVENSQVRVVLGQKQSDIIGEMGNVKVLHNFDDSGNIDEKSPDYQKSEDDKIAQTLDKKGLELEAYVNDKYVLDQGIQHRELKVFAKNQFYTSPVPDNSKQNTDNSLKKIRLILEKDKIFSFEIIRFNLIAADSINLKDLRIYIKSGDYVFPNVGGKSDSFFKYRQNTIYGTAVLGYNPPPGKYTLQVKSVSNPEWDGLMKPFTLMRRTVPEIKPGFSVVTMEYTVPLTSTKVRVPDGTIGDASRIADWVKFMGADAFWMLVSQTTGWNPEISPEKPWVSGGDVNLRLLAPVMRSNGIQVGAYIMCYYTPANGKKKVGYEPSLRFDRDIDSLRDSLHVSLNCKRRFMDIMNKAKEFQDNPHVDYIGFDFIRTGHLDGYEMGPEVVEDMNIAVPESYVKMPRIEKVKWFARQISVERNPGIIVKWRWWRAHKTATIINEVIVKGNITKPTWCFTLGWEHGKQHGQDPYMFFDAGVLIDAVMLYEANRIQFRNMMVHWPNYMRDNKNNVIIGNACDIRLLDGQSGNPAVEYLYRTRRGSREIYRSGMAKGVFFHDISRALWSSKRGYPTIEWAIINGTAISQYRYDLGLIPYRATIAFNPNDTSGVITIENTGTKKLHNIEVTFIPTESWEMIHDTIPANIDIDAGETLRYAFRARLRQGFEKKEAIIGYSFQHPQYPKYFAMQIYGKLNYDEFLLAAK